MTNSNSANKSSNFHLISLVFGTIILVFMCLIPVEPVGAFGLGEHAKITRIGFEEFSQCVDIPRQELKEDFAKLLADGSLREDTQYLRKSLQYSHFYHPDIFINAVFGVGSASISRCPSNFRLNHLQTTLAGVIRGESVPRDNFDWSWNPYSASSPRCERRRTDGISLRIYDRLRREVGVDEFLEGFNDLVEGDQEVAGEDETRHDGDGFTRENVVFIHGKYVYELGHGIHHIQDMASPPHVIPVMHPKRGDGHDRIIPKDGFEGYEYRDEVLDQIQSVSIAGDTPGVCNFLSLEPQDLVSNLDQEFNRTTEKLLGSFPARVASEDIPDPIPLENYSWENFWNAQVRDENGFGSYGRFRDNFGITEFDFEEGDEKILVRMGTNEQEGREIFDQFAASQYRQAIEATKRVLWWGWQQTQPLRDQLPPQ